MKRTHRWLRGARRKSTPLPQAATLAPLPPSPPTPPTLLTLTAASAAAASPGRCLLLDVTLRPSSEGIAAAPVSEAVPSIRLGNS